MALSEEHRKKLSDAAKSRSPEAEARRIAAMRASKKYQDRRKLPVYDTEEYREKQRQATKKKWESGVYEGRKEKTSATWTDKTPEEMAEHARKISEGQKANWAKAKAEGRRRNRHYGTRKRTSKHELALVPYMEALGFLHGTGKRIGHRVPDFVNDPAKQIYEYFGTYWHKPKDEQHTIEFYALRGWQCTVLWESDLFTFLADHEPLVTPEQHQHAWKVAHINNGYRKPRE